MPSSSIRELIVVNIDTVMAAISVGTGYNYTIVKTYRTRAVGVNIDQYPSIIVVDHDEEYQPNLMGIYEKTMNVSVEGWIQEYDNLLLSPAANRILHDMEKAIMADRTRGGYAKDTVMLSSTPFIEEPGKPYGGARLELAVRYRVSETDPTANGEP